MLMIRTAMICTVHTSWHERMPKPWDACSAERRMSLLFGPERGSFGTSGRYDVRTFLFSSFHKRYATVIRRDCLWMRMMRAARIAAFAFFLSGLLTSGAQTRLILDP